MLSPSAFYSKDIAEGASKSSLEDETQLAICPERVLTIASHVVFGYVGNSVTTFVLQSLGLEVSALNTVQFSNHTRYGQWAGYTTTANQIKELWEGLKDTELVDGYGMLLTGYVPGPDGVEAVGKIAKELKGIMKGCGRQLFWVLDPVMGDEGKLYVSAGVVPVYKSLMPYADLITPNQFETELLTGVTLDSFLSLSSAVDALHSQYDVPHIIITSIVFEGTSGKMICAGSSRTSDGRSRIFQVDVPVIEGTFVGTGDLFAALTLARLQQESKKKGLLARRSWLPNDEVLPTDLPLAKAVEKVLASMHMVLEKTKEARRRKLAETATKDGMTEKVRQISLMKASELQLVQAQKDLINVKDDFHAKNLEVARN